MPQGYWMVLYESLKQVYVSLLCEGHRHYQAFKEVQPHRVSHYQVSLLISTRNEMPFNFGVFFNLRNGNSWYGACPYVQ